MAGNIAVKKAVRRPRGYAGYIQSSQWKELRREAIDRDGGRCRVCDRKERLEVHHRKYPSAWKDDCLDNLTALCKDCHEVVTSLLRGRRYNSRADIRPRKTIEVREEFPCESKPKSGAPAPSFSTVGRSSIPKTNTRNAIKESQREATQNRRRSRRDRTIGISRRVLHCDDGGKIVMPDVNLMATIIEGAKKFKKGPAAKAGVYIDGHGVFDFPHKGDKSPKALWESKKFVDRRRVTIQRNSIIRVRPRFNDWSCEFELELDEEICNLVDVRQWLETAGNRSGLGDYRPIYGRFEVMEFKAEKSI